ncbi:MAG: hypothetical protein IPP17_26795 [Bacteroidetes bacterium]|nr:hypothetical protein [Bacteroidota bacterium]
MEGAKLESLGQFENIQNIQIYKWYLDNKSKDIASFLNRANITEIELKILTVEKPLITRVLSGGLEVQAWSFVLLLNFTNKLKICVPKPARTQSRETLLQTSPLKSPPTPEYSYATHPAPFQRPPDSSKSAPNAKGAKSP